jgi:hypothetical protein
MGKAYGPVIPGKKWFKALVAKIVFFFLGRVFQSASRHDPDVRAEIAAWPEGFIYIMNILPHGPRMVLKKEGATLKYLGGKATEGHLVVNFKNLEAAFMTLTPQISAAQAFAERRMTVKGDLANAMIFTRCLDILLAYMYPTFIVRRLVKRVPPMPLKKQFIRLYVLTLGIAFGI